MVLRQHPPRRLLGDQEGAIGGDRERLLHVDRIELDERPAGAEARIVDHDVGRAEGGLDVGEQLLDIGALAGVAGEGLRIGLLNQRVEIAGAARGERDLDAFLGQSAGERGGKPGAGADDERGIESVGGHDLVL